MTSVSEFVWKNMKEQFQNKRIIWNYMIYGHDEFTPAKEQF